MKVLFLGQGRLACLCLRVLMGSGFKERISLASIVTNESFYEGLRSENEACRDLPFISNHVRNEQLILESVESMGVDALVSVQHKWILSSDVISSVSGKVFNLHNAKLPDYKGHNTISFAILNDEKNYSVTIHWVVPEVDEGDLIKESIIPISPEDTALSLYRKNHTRCGIDLSRVPGPDAFRGRSQESLIRWWRLLWKNRLGTQQTSSIGGSPGGNGKESPCFVLSTLRTRLPPSFRKKSLSPSRKPSSQSLA